MCGILGIIGYEDVSRDLIYGLNCIQHRGQDSAGIVTFQDSFKTMKGLGLVNDIFNMSHVERLKANCGLGHVRYSTMGTTEVLNAQPISVNYPFGLAMVHNGNVTNYSELRKAILEDSQSLLETSNDIEIILYTLASELEKKNIKYLTPSQLFEAVEITQSRLEGSYAALAIIANKGIVGFNDPRGIRPLVLGEKTVKKGKIYALVSESTCLDYLGFKKIKDLKAGECVFIDINLKVHSKILNHKPPAFCIFEYIYFAREDSVIFNRLVAKERENMGKLLAKQIKKLNLDADIVIDVPSSSYFFASALAEGIGIPMKRALTKNNFVGRSFILPNPKDREHAVCQKLNPIKEFINGKKVAVVDDSIVRGTTSKKITSLLREAGAEKVYFISASPPIKFPCVYGVDMSIKTELIASNGEDKVAEAIGADKVIYLDLDSLKEFYNKTGFCYACFDGKYPTMVPKTLLKEIEKDREKAKLSAN